MDGLRASASSPGYSIDGPYFRQGLGDRSRIEAIVETAINYDIDAPPLPLEVTRERHFLSLLGPRIVQLTFRSPGACWLPDECHTARAELVLPPGAEDDRPPICLMLPATAEETFALRRWLAIPLLRHGIGVAILETPFYGKRRATGQLGPLIRTLADQLCLNIATVEEARALLYWLRAEGYMRLGITGYSQGGIMTAFTAAVTRFPVAAIPRAAPFTARSLVLNGPVRRALCWTKLAADLGGIAAAERFLTEVLEPIRVDALPVPVAASCAVIVSARDDRLISEEHGVELARYWSGSELRIIDGGHVTALLRAAQHVDAIHTSFSRISVFERHRGSSLLESPAGRDDPSP
ncbi:MAG: alpha/beta hydrolase family protein [Polyangiaceae bacterium]|nr:alpha/beta hydrolase family protein [Polyangiaceae bacterium]